MHYCTENDAGHRSAQSSWAKNPQTQRGVDGAGCTVDRLGLADD